MIRLGFTLRVALFCLHIFSFYLSYFIVFILTNSLWHKDCRQHNNCGHASVLPVTLWLRKEIVQSPWSEYDSHSQTIDVYLLKVSMDSAAIFKGWKKEKCGFYSHQEDHVSVIIPTYSPPGTTVHLVHKLLKVDSL